MTVPAEILGEHIASPPRGHWKAERDARVVELRKAGKTLEEIRMIAGVHSAAAAKIIAAAGLPRTLGTARRRVISPRVEDVVSRYVGGETMQEIGDDLGVTRERVRQLIKKWEHANDQRVPRAQDQFSALYSCRWCGKKTQYKIHCSRRCSSTSVAFAAAERRRDVAVPIVVGRVLGMTWASLCETFDISMGDANRFAFYGALLLSFTADQLSLIWPRHSGKFRAKFERLSSHRKFPNTGSSPNSPAILSANPKSDSAGPAPTGPADCNGARRHG